MKKPNLSIDLATVNADERDTSHQYLGTTYRAEGLSIGRNYLRFEGEIIAETPSIDEFIIDRTIGRGISSVVFRARLKGDRSKTNYALKEFKLDNKANQDVYVPGLDATEKKKQSSMVIQELKVLCKLQCECLVQLVGAFYEPGVVIMAMEYMDYGSLAQFLRIGEYLEIANHEMPPRILSENALSGAAYQILWGLAYLHHENIIHRDIKPENILLNSLGQVKVSDMGISGCAAFAKTGDDATISGLNHTVIGTSKYMSPERILDKSYGPLCDMWSFGLVLIEVATGGWSPLYHENKSDNRPTYRKGISIVELAETLQNFNVDEVIKCLSKNALGKKKIPGEVDWCKVATTPLGQLGEILIWSLQRAPNKRMPAQTLLKSPWFQRHGVLNIEIAQQSMRHCLNTLV